MQAQLSPAEGERVAATPPSILVVNNIEVIYNHVVLVLKGVSLAVPQGRIVALLGGNGAGKTTTLRAISNLLNAERGEVTKGTITFDGAQVQSLTPDELVKRGCIQVMEGRHCFGHLTVEENLMTGAFTRRDGSAAIRRRESLVSKSKDIPITASLPTRGVPSSSVMASTAASRLSAATITSRTSWRRSSALSRASAMARRVTARSWSCVGVISQA